MRVHATTPGRVLVWSMERLRPLLSILLPPGLRSLMDIAWQPGTTEILAVVYAPATVVLWNTRTAAKIRLRPPRAVASPEAAGRDVGGGAHGGPTTLWGGGPMPFSC